MNFTYPEVGATAKLGAPHVRRELAARYDVDHRTFVLGRGQARYERARAALLAWRQFEVPWLRFHAAGPVVADQVVTSETRLAGIRFENPCRVVYLELEPSDRVAYAYGTLPGHAECGEERFEVVIDPGSEEVRYQLSAFSRPARLLVKIGYPLARSVQRRFAHASARALERAAR